MSKRNAEKFLEEAKQNKELQKRLTQLGEAYQGDERNLESVVKQNILPVAEEMNLLFTVEEYMECVRGQIRNRELSEEEMDQVVGGVGDVNMPESETGGDVTIIDQHKEYNFYFVMPGAAPDMLKKLFGW